MNFSKIFKICGVAVKYIKMGAIKYIKMGAIKYIKMGAIKYIKMGAIWIWKNFLSKFSFKDWLLVIVSCLLIWFFFQYKHYKNGYSKIVYLTNDTISYYENKINDEYVLKTLYEMDKKSLQEYNTTLYNELQNLKDNPLIITKTEIRWKTPKPISTEIDSVSTVNNSYKYYWSYKEPKNWFYISGNSTIDTHDFQNFSNVIDTLTMKSDIFLDVIEKDHKFNVIARATNPYIQISNINSVIIDPKESTVLQDMMKQKQKKWGVGPMIGVGIDKNLKFTPYIGVGITYNLFSF